MTEAQEVKKPRAKRAKATPKADLVEMATATVAETQSALFAQPILQLANPAAQPVAAGIIFSSVQEQGDAFRKAVREAVTVSAQGAFEVNGKIIEALNVQSHAALDLWRSAMSAPHLSEAFQTQTSATRQAYETASAQWKDIAETTARWFTKSFEPLQSALHRPGR